MTTPVCGPDLSCVRGRLWAAALMGAAALASGCGTGIYEDLAAGIYDARHGDHHGDASFDSFWFDYAAFDGGWSDAWIAAGLPAVGVYDPGYAYDAGFSYDAGHFYGPGYSVVEDPGWPADGGGSIDVGVASDAYSEDGYGWDWDDPWLDDPWAYEGW